MLGPGGGGAAVTAKDVTVNISVQMEGRCRVCGKKGPTFAVDADSPGICQKCLISAVTAKAAKR